MTTTPYPDESGQRYCTEASSKSVYEHLNADRPAAKVTHGSIELHSVWVLHLVTHNDKRCAHNRSANSQSEQVR